VEITGARSQLGNREHVRVVSVIVSLPLILSLGFAAAQPNQAPRARIDFSDPNGVIHQLAPDDAAPADVAVDPADRLMVIRLLRKAKHDDVGWHKQLAIYLLIRLGQDGDRNTLDLIHIWRSEGDEDTMGLIILLYRHGRPELLKTILEAGPHSDAALAEELGNFFGEELQSHPK
jgi:hypothetical protein